MAYLDDLDKLFKIPEAQLSDDDETQANLTKKSSEFDIDNLSKIPNKKIKKIGDQEILNDLENKYQGQVVTWDGQQNGNENRNDLEFENWLWVSKIKNKK